MPPVQIRLVDPSKREEGVDISGEKIPVSRYAEVVELPKLPQRSRVRAIEICGAEAGAYEIVVYEHGSDTYRLSVGVDGAEYMSTNLQARKGWIRHFRFQLRNEDRKLSLTWLDNKGHPKFYAGDGDTD